MEQVKGKSLECIFLSFEKEIKGYKLWERKTRKKMLSRDVVFDELTASRIEANDVAKKNIISIEIPIIKKIAS